MATSQRSGPSRSAEKEEESGEWDTSLWGGVVFGWEAQMCEA